MNSPASESGDCACPLCKTAGQADASYFARPFGEPQLCMATGEALSESLGFCSRHSEILLSNERRLGDTGPALRAAAYRLTLLLDQKYLQTAEVQQILFNTDGSCPACTYTNRILGRHAARLARVISGEAAFGMEQTNTLCIRHFRMLEANLAPDARLPLLSSYSGHLEELYRKLTGLSRSEYETGAWPHCDAAAQLSKVIGLVSASSACKPAPFCDAFERIWLRHTAFSDRISTPEVCPVCVEVERSRKRWLQKVEIAGDFDEDAWFILPTCPEHVGMIARLGQPSLTATVISRTLSMAIRQNSRRIQVLAGLARIKEEEARIRAQGPEAWAAYKRQQTYRRRSSQKTGEHAEPKPKTARCPACEWEELATERATGNLIELLHEKKHRDAFQRGYGLCLKHFARVYLIAPRGPIRAMLSDDIQSRLAELVRQLDDSDARRAETGTRRYDAALISSLRRFCNCM